MGLDEIVCGWLRIFRFLLIRGFAWNMGTHDVLEVALESLRATGRAAQLPRGSGYARADGGAFGRTSSYAHGKKRLSMSPPHKTPKATGRKSHGLERSRKPSVKGCKRGVCVVSPGPSVR